jgi:hypothetical protein
MSAVVAAPQLRVLSCRGGGGDGQSDLKDTQGDSWLGGGRRHSRAAQRRGATTAVGSRWTGPEG